MRSRGLQSFWSSPVRREISVTSFRLVWVSARLLYRGSWARLSFRLGTALFVPPYYNFTGTNNRQGWLDILRDSMMTKARCGLQYTLSGATSTSSLDLDNSWAHLVTSFLPLAFYHRWWGCIYFVLAATVGARFEEAGRLVRNLWVSKLVVGERYHL